MGGLRCGVGSSRWGRREHVLGPRTGREPRARGLAFPSTLARAARVPFPARPGFVKNRQFQRVGIANAAGPDDNEQLWPGPVANDSWRMSSQSR